MLQDNRALKARGRVMAVIVAAALFMEQLDGTVLSTALPSIAASFHVDPLRTASALTSYMLALAVFIPASGPIADRFGSRTVLMGAITVFLVGSVLCAQATGLITLSLARVVQGAGGAMMVPVGRLILLRTVPKANFVNAMFWMLTPASLAPLVGPLIGGVLTTYLNWRWVFYINIPVGILGLILTRRFIPQIREPNVTGFDLRGFFIAGVGLAAFVQGAEWITHGRNELLAAGSMFVAAIVAGLLYWGHTTQVTRPVLDIRLLSFKTFRLSLLAGAFSRIGVGALPFLVPSFLQLGFHLSAAQAGFVIFVAPIGAVLARVCTTRLFRRFGFRKIVMIMEFGSSAVFVFFAIFRPGMPFYALTIVLFLTGMIQAVQFAVYNSIAYADIPTSRTSAATSFYATFQQLTLSLGVCIAAGAMAVSRVVTHHQELMRSDFSVAFWLLAVTSLFAIPISACLGEADGAEMSGYAGSAKGK